MISSDCRTSDATRNYSAMKKYQCHCRTLCATHQPRTPLRCRHGNVKRCHKLRQALAERSNHAQSGGLVTRTVVTVHVLVSHVPFVAALWHQLPLHGDHMPPYKTESCMNCELHLATRHLWRNTEGRPSDPKEDTLEEQRPHFSHKKVVCTTQVSPSGRRPGRHRLRR